MADDLDPDEAQAILRFFTQGRPVKRARGQRPDMGLPVIPELLDEVELFFSRCAPEQDHDFVAKIAQRWKRAGFTMPDEIQEWLDIGVTLSDPVIAGEFKLQGIPARLAGLNGAR